MMSNIWLLCRFSIVPSRIASKSRFFRNDPVMERYFAGFSFSGSGVSLEGAGFGLGSVRNPGRVGVFFVVFLFFFDEELPEPVPGRNPAFELSSGGVIRFSLLSPQL